MSKKINHGVDQFPETGATRVSVLVVEGNGDTLHVTSEKPGKATAIIGALDRTFAAYSDEIEAETRSMAALATGLFDAFRHAFKLPTAQGVKARHHREVQLDERQLRLDEHQHALDTRERDLDAKGSALEVRETMLQESRMALDQRADELSKREEALRHPVITGESVTLLPDGSAEVQVIVGADKHTYREVTVLGPDGQLVTSSYDLPTTLTRIMNFYGVDASTGMADHVLAAKILEHVGRLREMNAEIQDTGDRLALDPELEDNADDSDGPKVGTAPLGLEAVREATRKRDRNLT